MPRCLIRMNQSKVILLQQVVVSPPMIFHPLKVLSLHVLAILDLPQSVRMQSPFPQYSPNLIPHSFCHAPLLAFQFFFESPHMPVVDHLACKIVVVAEQNSKAWRPECGECRVTEEPKAVVLHGSA